MKYSLPKFARLLALTVFVVGFQSNISALLAQEASKTDAPDAVDPDEAETVKLSPYLVSTARDKGYYSEQSLIGARYGKSIHDIPASISIINKELLDDIAAYDLLEPLKYTVPGVTLNQPDADDWQIRGFRTRGGFRNGRRSAFGGFASSTWDVERLEVLKGPAGMMTGVNSSAIGGTVNYITNKPTETRRTWISAQFGQFGEYRVQGLSSGPVAQYGDTKLLYLVNLGKWERGFDNELAAWDENFIGFSVQAKFSPTSVLTLAYTHLSRNYMAVLDSDLTDPVAYQAGIFKLRTDIPRKRNIRGPGDDSDLINEYIEVDFTHKFSDHLSTRIGYQYTVEDQDNLWVSLLAYDPNSNYLVRRRATSSGLIGRANQVQLDLIGNFNTGPFKHALSGGLDYDFGNTNQHRFLQFNMPTVDIRNPDLSQDVAIINANKFPAPGSPRQLTRRLGTIYSYFIQENLSFWKDRIVLISGLRWLDSFATTQTFSNNSTSSQNPPALRLHRHGVIFKPFEGVSLFAVEAINHFPSSDQVANPGTPFEYTFPASDGVIEEFGLKYNLFNGKLYGSISTFDLARTNVRSSRLATFPDGTIRLIEAHLDTTTDGWEMDLGSRVDFPLGTVDFIGTYYSGETTTPKAGSATGERLPAYNAPSYITSGMVKISFKNPPLKGLSVGGSIRRESQVYMVSPTVINNRPMTGTLFTSYSINDHLTVNLNVDNVTDEQYVISGGPVWGDAALGRRLRFTTKYSF